MIVITPLVDMVLVQLTIKRCGYLLLPLLK